MSLTRDVRSREFTAARQRTSIFRVPFWCFYLTRDVHAHRIDIIDRAALEQFFIFLSQNRKNGILRAGPGAREKYGPAVEPTVTLIAQIHRNRSAQASY